MTRPAENLTAAIGSIIGALFIVMGAFDEGGFKLALRSSEFQGAVIVLVSWIAWGVTAYISSRQRAGELRAAKDGAVLGAPS